MKSNNVKNINIDFPTSFHLWLEPKAKLNERAKRAELKLIATESLQLNPDLSGLDESLYQGHTQNVKWISLVLPLSAHLLLEKRAQESNRTKAEELKLLCLWMQQQEG
ncbi:TPA: hypothetical protein ACS8CE_003436 [Providencia alcalifaciens]